MDAGLVILLLLLLLLAPRPAVQNLMAHLPHFFNDPLLGLAGLLHVSAGVLDDAQQGLNFGPQFRVLFQSGFQTRLARGKGFSISEKRSVMVWISFRPRDPFYLYDFEAFVHSPSTELGWESVKTSTEGSPHLTRTFNCTRV